MPTAIAVTSADMALPPQDERTLPAVVLRDVDRRPLEQALAEMQALVEHHGHVIVVCSQAAPTAVRRQLQSDWVTGTLAPSWKVQGLRETPLPAESPGWWGTGKLIEFCSYLPDLSVLYQLVTSVRRSQCHWCGIDVIGDRCVFCSATPPVHDSPPRKQLENRTAVG